MQDFKKMKGGRLGDIKKFLKIESKKFLKKNYNFEQSHSADILKKGTLWDFLTFVLLQNIKKNWKEDSLGTFKKFRKKVSQNRKKVSQSRKVS